MNELLSEYDEALRTKGSEIRNHEGRTSPVAVLLCIFILIVIY